MPTGKIVNTTDKKNLLKHIIIWLKSTAVSKCKLFQAQQLIDFVRSMAWFIQTSVCIKAV